MKITRLKLRNLKYISNQDIKLTTGLNTFVGSNGSGKTTLLNIINSLIEYIHSDYSHNMNMLNYDMSKYYKGNESEINSTFSISFEESQHTGTSNIVYTKKNKTLDKKLFPAYKLSPDEKGIFINDISFLKSAYFDLSIIEEKILFEKIKDSLTRLDRLMKNNLLNLRTLLRKEKVKFLYPETCLMNGDRPTSRIMYLLDFGITYNFIQKEFYFSTPNKVIFEIYKEIRYLIGQKYNPIIQKSLEDSVVDRRSSTRVSTDTYDVCYSSRENAVLKLGVGNSSKIINKLQNDVRNAPQINDNTTYYERLLNDSLKETETLNSKINLKDNNYLSSGEECYLDFKLSKIHINNNNVVIIDEPELSLHYTAQKVYLDELYILIGYYNAQIFIATHSSSFVHGTIGNIIRLSNRGSKQITIENNLKRYFNEDFLSKVIFADKVILVEGIADYIYFNKILNWYKFYDSKESNFKRINNISIIDIGGKANFKYYIQMLKEIGITDYYIIADLDFIEDISKENDNVIESIELKQKCREIISRNRQNIPSKKLNKQIKNNTRSKETSNLLSALENAINSPSKDSFVNAVTMLKSRVKELNRLDFYHILDSEGVIEKLENLNIFLLNYELESYLNKKCKNENNKAHPEKMINYFSKDNFYQELSVLFVSDDKYKQVKHIFDNIIKDKISTE